MAKKKKTTKKSSAKKSTKSSRKSSSKAKSRAKTKKSSKITKDEKNDEKMLTSTKRKSTSKAKSRTSSKRRSKRTSAHKARSKSKSKITSQRKKEIKNEILTIIRDNSKILLEDLEKLLEVPEKEIEKIINELAEKRLIKITRVMVHSLWKTEIREVKDYGIEQKKDKHTLQWDTQGDLPCFICPNISKCSVGQKETDPRICKDLEEWLKARIKGIPYISPFKAAAESEK